MGGGIAGKQDGAEDERSIAGGLEPAWGEQLGQEMVKSHMQEQEAQQGPGFSDLPQMSMARPSHRLVLATRRVQVGEQAVCMSTPFFLTTP